MRVLIIDDEAMLVRTFQLGWPDPDDEIVSAASYAEAQRLLYSNKILDFDCIILDLQLPDASGSTILAEIRKRTSTPVIMLSAWGDSQFRAGLIGEGADDYVMKPVGIDEIYARTRRLASGRTGQKIRQDGPVSIGTVAFDAASRRMSGNCSSAVLTGAEASILTALADASGGVVSRHTLYMKGFGREERHGEKALETYIGRLRQKLTSLGEDGTRRILNERGLGYRLVARKG